MSHSQPSLSVDPQEVERSAFNAAFYELGLRWHWDGPTYDALARESCERSRVRRYVEVEQSHLLRAYEADFLTDAILVAKDKFKRSLGGCDPRTMPSFNWADARWGEVGF
jgi:hypothetical protein